jgi:PPOX class probable F420-dependent enzyme
MAAEQPETTLDPRYSSGDATAVDWERARELLARAELYWISTVRPDGRPHVTPLIAVWLDGALYFSTGEEERKARNLAANPHVVMTTGVNSMDDGLDVVVEGEAVAVRDDARLRELADALLEKYGEAWRPEVGDGGFRHTLGDEHGKVLVFEVVPTTAFGFGKGERFSQTRWRF